MDKVDVRGDGRVILYKRVGLKNLVYQARLRIPNAAGYKIVTTKTGNLREAERIALNLYEDLYMTVRAGGAIKPRSFKQVFEEWEKTVTTASTRQGKSWQGTVDRIKSYAIGFFGVKKITEIGEGDFADYWVWRKSNYARKLPSNGTLKRERASLMPVFKYAVTKGYISTLPVGSAPSAKSVRRPTFTLEEWRVLSRKMREWVKASQSKVILRDRMVAQQTFLILANTGVRIGELRSLRWSDLRTVKTEEGTRLVGYVRGKTGAREVVFQQGAEEYVKRLYDMRQQEVVEAAGDVSSPQLDRNQIVVCHPDGSAIQTMKRSFESLLKFAGISAQRDGGTRTLYSLRHFYATQRLSHETSPFLLAKQMGTSVEMLEKFYGQTVTSTLAAQISKSGKRREIGESDKQYPFE